MGNDRFSEFTPEQRRRLVRAQLLEAVVAVVAERGYARLRVADVISRCGLSRSVFYEFFANREEAFFAAWDSLIARAIRRMRAAGLAHSDPAEQVTAALSALIELSDCDPPCTRLLADAPVAAALSGDRERHLRRAAEWLDQVRSELGLDPLVGPGEQVTIGLTLLGAERTGQNGNALLDALQRVIMGRGAPDAPPARPPRLAEPPRLQRIRAALQTGEPGALGELLVESVEERDREALGLLSQAAPSPLQELSAAAMAGGAGGLLRAAGARRRCGETTGQGRRVLLALHQHGELGSRGVGEALGIRHASQLSRLLTELERSGLAAHRRQVGGRKAWRLTEAGAEAVRFASPSAAARQ